MVNRQKVYDETFLFEGGKGSTKIVVKQLRWDQSGNRIRRLQM